MSHDSHPPSNLPSQPPSLDPPSHISHTINPSAPSIPLPILRTLALHAPLDQISNSPGSVRHHIYSHSRRNKTTNRLEDSMLFWVYQTGRHGPQNGWRLCLVHQGFFIASPHAQDPDPESESESTEKEEDEIDKLEKEIPQGHMEVFILGREPEWPVSDDDDEKEEEEKEDEEEDDGVREDIGGET